MQPQSGVAYYIGDNIGGNSGNQSDAVGTMDLTGAVNVNILVTVDGFRQNLKCRRFCGTIAGTLISVQAQSMQAT